MGSNPLTKISPAKWQLGQEGGMHVPGIVYASDVMIDDILQDQALKQVSNVAHLPGIVKASFAMPDIHFGYGFPIGGLAATDVANGGVISPGGVGYDIGCGVRLLATSLTWKDISSRHVQIMDAINRSIHAGTGPGASWKNLSLADLDQVLEYGAKFAVENGYGDARDLDYTEDYGYMKEADPSLITKRAKERGAKQLGSLGSGNHFVELQRVDRVVRPNVAEQFGLFKDQIVVLIHSGSRGLGHQTCTDHLHAMQPAMNKYGIVLPDRQLACTPVKSDEGQRYLSAMAAAGNFARANRQVMTEEIRKAIRHLFKSAEVDVVYDVSHNLAKIERHEVNGKQKTLCVHRKGSTRALSKGHEDLPKAIRDYGQPVFIPGSMGTASWVCAGTDQNDAFNTTCHGAGRMMSRKRAKSKIQGHELRRQLEKKGILIRTGSLKDLPEEAPFAYKDVDNVVKACEEASLANLVARLVPLGVIKG